MSVTSGLLVTVSAALGLLPLVSFAQDECSDQIVLSNSDKHSTLEQEWTKEWQYAKKKPDGGLQATPRSAVLSAEMTPLMDNIYACADKGNAWAMYFRGMETAALAELTKGVSEIEDFRQFAPADSTKIAVRAMTSLKEANNWFLLSAEKGNPAAMRQLGLNHSRGVGFPQNRLVAMEWFHKAASIFLDSGNRNAALIVGNDMREIDAQHPLTLRIMGRLYPK